MKIYTYRYMWRVSGNDSINLKIVTDTKDGLRAFEKSLIDSVDNLDSFAREYLHEYDCTLLGKFENLYLKENN